MCAPERKQNSPVAGKPLALVNVVNLYQTDPGGVVFAADDGGAIAGTDYLDQGRLTVVARLQAQRCKLGLLPAQFPVVVRAQGTIISCPLEPS